MDKNISPLPWRAEGERVRGTDGRLIASFWLRRVDEDQQDKESWLDMRHRTQPDRDAADAEMRASSAFAVKAVNAHDQLVEALVWARSTLGNSSPCAKACDAALAAAEGK